MTAPQPIRRVTGKLFGLALLLSVGCSSYRSVNTPLTQLDAAQQLHPRATSLQAQRPEEIAIVLALSGGGTRAAAFSYGVLQELRDTSIGKTWTEEVKTQDQTTHPHLIEVSFDAIEDPTERHFFNNVPTSFTLDEQTVDRLAEAGRRLLRESKEFQALLSAIQ